MHKSIVSIIVPVYNVEDYLIRCIESLINQTYSDLEIILVNDGSPDNSPQICDDYSNWEPRIRVIHKENGGLSDARNVGIEAATGEYIMFLDSDDYVEVNLVERAMNAILNEDFDLVIWGYYADFLNDKHELTTTVDFKGIKGSYDSSNFNDIEVSHELIGLLGYAWNKLYKADIIKDNKIQFPKNISLVEDIIFNSKVIVASTSITFIEDCLVHYMQRPEPTLGNMFYKNYFDLKLKAMEAVENILKFWNQDSNKIEKITNGIGFDSLKLTVKELSEYTKFKKSEKYEYLNHLFKDEKVLKVLSNVEVSSIKDKFIRQLMIRNQSKLLLKIYNSKIYRGEK